MERASLWIPYCGPAPAPMELLTRWNLDPALLLGLILAAAASLWFRGTFRIERRWSLPAMALLALLFISPFCALTSALFSARTVHHLLLTSAVAPLLAIAAPARRVPGGLALWTGLHAATFWLWHVPAAYSTALSSHAVYWLMQASLLLTAWAMWRAIVAASPLAATTGLLATMVQMGLLGALLTFSIAAAYPPHFSTTLAWGLTPLADQQLAGLLMWVAGAGLYLAAALFLLARWFAQEQEAAIAT